jgi:AsmA protein
MGRAAIAGYGALGLGCLLAAAITFLLIAAPVDLVRDRVVELVKARTGRDLVVGGPASLSLLPHFAVAFSQVSLTAPEGMDAPPILATRSLQVELSLWSLLSRQVAVRRVVLDGPAIELRVDAQGRRSWDFAAGAGGSARLAPTSGGADDVRAEAASGNPGVGKHKGARLPLSHLLGASVRIRDGVIHYLDERSGTSREIAGLDIEVAVDDAGDILQGKGGAAWKDEKFTFDGKVSPISAALQGEEAQFVARIAGQPFEAAYEGTLSLAGEGAFAGTLDIRAPSASALAQLFGGHRRGPAEVGPFALSSKVSAAGRRVALSDLSATVGDSSVSGALSVETEAARPRVRGQLHLSELDLGRLLIRPGRTSSAAAGDDGSDPTGGSSRRGPDVDPASRGRNSAKHGGKGWSDDIVDLSPLALADADVTLSVDKVVYKNIATGRGRLSLALQDRVARLTLEDVQLYGGQGRGVLTLDGTGQASATAVDLTLDGISVQPLLKDALDFTWLDGRGRIVLAIAGQGPTDRHIVETLQGKVEMSTTNGAIVGMDIARLVGNIERAKFSGLEMGPQDRTPFSELSASFVIADGVAQNQDLQLVSPHLRVSGSGSANLALRQVSYLVRPKIAASAAGDGAVVNLAGLEIPVRIEGAWEKPSIVPDVKGVLSSPAAGEALKQIGKNIKSQEVQDAVRSLLGGGDGQQKVKPRDLLEKLLKKD